MTHTTRILIVDICTATQEHLRALAVATIGDSTAIDMVSSFETAVTAASQKAYDLVLLNDDLGTGTNAFISVVTLRAAGCTGSILVTGLRVEPKRQNELSRIGVTDYYAKDALTAAHVRRALAA